MSNRFVVFLPSVLLGLGALAISGMRQQYIVPPTQPMATTPSTMLGLTGTEVVVDSAERAVAGMSDYALRSYAKDSVEGFSTYIGYYDRQVQGKSIHSPKNCLPGAGWEILENGRVSVTAATGDQRLNRVLLSNRGQRALVYYWYQGRGRIESSEYRVKWDLLRDAALYGRTEEALVRIVVQIPRSKDKAPTGSDGEVQAADVLARQVAQQLIPQVDKVLPTSPRAS